MAVLPRDTNEKIHIVTISSSQTNRWIPKERFSITWDRRTVRIIFVAASNPIWFVEHSPG
jgi:hypothetical protein